MRQFVPIGLLSSIALGVAAADVLTAVVRRIPRGAAQLAGAVVIILGLVTMVPVVLTQDRTPIEESKGDLDQDLAKYFSALPGVPGVLTSFRFKARALGSDRGRRRPRRARVQRGEAPAEARRSSLDRRDRSCVYRTMPRTDLAGQLRGARVPGAERTAPVRADGTRDLARTNTARTSA